MSQIQNTIAEARALLNDDASTRMRAENKLPAALTAGSLATGQKKADEMQDWIKQSHLWAGSKVMENRYGKAARMAQRIMNKMKKARENYAKAETALKAAEKNAKTLEAEYNKIVIPTHQALKEEHRRATRK